MEELIKNQETGAVSEIQSVSNEKKKADKQDKIAALKAKKADKALEKATNKVAAVDALIAAEEQKLHDKDIKKLDSLCTKLNVELSDIIRLIEKISDSKLTITEAAEMLDVK